MTGAELILILHGDFGGRDFADYDKLRDACDEYLLDAEEDIEIVSGGAKGVDSLGEQFARERDMAISKFPANWKEHGKAAGIIRNSQMADYADMLIAFWDGDSRGTKNMIETARKKRLIVNVNLYN